MYTSSAIAFGGRGVYVRETMTTAHVLAATDLSDVSHAATQTARWWAAAMDARVTLLYVVEGTSLLDLPEQVRHELDGQLREVARERLEARVAELFDGLEVEWVMLEPGAAPDEDTAVLMPRSISGGICRVAQERGVTTVVVGTHGRSGFEHLLLGSTAEKVVRLSPCEVLAVKPAEGGGGALGLVERILCPVDFSPGSERALARAVELAERFDASLHVLHVAPAPVRLLADVPMDTSALEQGARDQLDALVEPLRERLDGLETAVVVGRPAPAIVDEAAATAVHLIVMGTLGRTGLSRLLLGSVAERVVRAATCPVLTVPARS